MMHIAERFAIHFASATFLTVCVYFLLLFWLRRNRKVRTWISTEVPHMLVTSALIVFSLATLREPFDVWFGNQVWYKAIFDQISWLAGCAVAAWGLYRYRK
ncbi:MAG: hypothetical protein N3A02_07525 [Rectinema sp.]|nr:hypothetical protein [Rectinema sp.]